MGLRLRLNWYDKKSDIGIGREYSQDLGDDAVVIETLGLPVDGTVNNGEFDIVMEWVSTLQPYFLQQIDLAQHDYQVAFDYRDVW